MVLIASMMVEDDKSRQICESFLYTAGTSYHTLRIVYSMYTAYEGWNFRTHGLVLMGTKRI